MKWGKILGGLGLLSVLACRSTLSLSDPAPMVPSHIGQVLAINSAKMGQKMPMKAIEDLSFVSFLKANAANDPNGQRALDVLKNWHNLGIDFSKRIYLCTDNASVYVYFILNNPKRFAKNFKKKVKKEGAIRYMTLGEKAEVAWQGNVGILALRGIKGLSKKADFSDDMAQESPMPPLSKAELFGLKPQNSMAAHADFQKLLAENHDITNFSPFGRSILYNLLDKKPFSGLLDRMDEAQVAALSEAMVLGHTDFNMGEMLSQSRFSIDSLLGNPLSQMFRPHLPTGFNALAQHPNLMAMANLGLNAPKFMEMAKAGLLSEAEMGSVAVADTLMQAFDGSVLAGIYMGDSMNMNVVVAAQLIDPEMVKLKLVEMMGDRLEKLNDNLFYLKRRSLSLPTDDEDILITDDDTLSAPDEELIMPDTDAEVVAWPDTAVSVTDSSEIEAIRDEVVVEETMEETTTDETEADQAVQMNETDLTNEEEFPSIVPDDATPEPPTRPNPLRTKPDYWLFKDNILYLTDSLTARQIEAGLFFTAASDTEKKLTDGQMNVYFNLSQLMSNLSQSVPTGLVGNMFEAFPIQEFHSNITGNKAFTRLKMVDKTENSFLSMVKTVDKLLGFYFSFMKK